jgi:hypothetical protein
MAKLQEMEEEFHVMECPGNSPDLNPTENCWANMKAKLKMNSAITTLPKLAEAIKLMWVRDLPLDYFQSLSSSMPRHIKGLIAARPDDQVLMSELYVSK